MNVFVLTTGRTGSTTLTKACSHITNYSAAHESRINEIGDERLEFPLNHIEIDNRLSFYLGSLDKKYGNNALYVHLMRSEEKVSNSFNNRWSNRPSIMRAFAENIKYFLFEKLNDDEKYRLSVEYVKMINDNIDLFLKDKKNVLRVDIDNMDTDFKLFWEFIEAKGDYTMAINEFAVKYNPTKIIKFKPQKKESKTLKTIKRIKKILK